MIPTDNITATEKMRIQDLAKTIADNFTATQNGEQIQPTLLNFLEGFVAGFKLAAALNNSNNRDS